MNFLKLPLFQVLTKMIRNSIKLVTFDVTGTLLKFRKSPTSQYIEFGEKYGVKVDENKIKESFSSNWKVMNAQEPNYGKCWKTWWTNFVVKTFKDSAVREEDEEKLKLIALDLIDHFSTSASWEMIKGGSEVLEALKKEIPLLGVISNFDSRLGKILEVTGLGGYFDFLVLSHQIGVSKPDRGIFDAALTSASNLSQSPILPSAALHIGNDAVRDFEGAKKAGWKAILVNADQRDSGCDDLLSLHQHLFDIGERFKRRRN